VTSKALVDFYDSLAVDYGVNLGRIYPTYLKWKLLETYVKPDFVCVELGVANGLFAIPLSRLTKWVFGSDISSKMLLLAKESCKEKKIVNLDFYQATAEKIALSGESVNFAYSFSTLLFLPQPEFTFYEVHRVLKPGGLAIFDLTGKYNLSNKYWNRFYRRQGHFGITSYSLEEASKALVAAGFTILDRHASGLTDQWKYVPGLRYLRFLDKIFHSLNGKPDFDYWLSQMLPQLANRWYFVIQKPA